MLIGRGRELDGAEALLGAAAAGRGGLRVLSGAPGIGKTRLADEIAARASARGFCVGWARSWETDGAPAYFPWLEAVTQLAEVAPEAAARFPRVLHGAHHAAVGESLRADAARERFELFDCVTSALRAIAREMPILLLFDDLHRADQPSLELLSFVARGLRGARIAVIATWRDVGASTPGLSAMLARIAREGETFVLRALNDAEVGEVVRHEIGHFDASLAAELCALTEGNPLFLREMLHAVAASAEPLQQSALGTIALGGVLPLVRERLRGAEAETRTLLEIAATIGREVEFPLLRDVALASPDETRRRLDQAVERGILFRRGQELWVFSHVLVREAFYEELSSERRRELHSRIASLLSKRFEAGREELLATLAHHSLAALPLIDAERAIEIARLAAERARGQLAFEEAIGLLERALEACQTFDLSQATSIEVLLALGWAVTEISEVERGRELFRRAARLARSIHDPKLLARAALGQGGQYVMAEIRDELVSVLRESLSALGDADDEETHRLRARVLARLAAALTPSATPEEPLSLARRALCMSANETDTRTRIDVDVGVGAAFADFAPPSERISVNERLLRDARAVRDRVLELRALTRLACDHLECADFAGADAAIAARAALGDELGHARYRWQTPLLRSMRAMPAGRFDECDAAVREAEGLAPQASDPNATRCIEVHRFFMYWLAGRTDELCAQQPATLRVLGTLPDLGNHSQWVTAVVAARRGERERARDALVAALGPSNIITARLARLALADAAALAGSRELCEQIYARFDPADDSNACFGPFAFVCGFPVATVLAALAFALGRPGRAIEHAELALSIARRTGAEAHEAWTRLTLGEGQLEDSRRKAELERAIELATRLRMPEIVKRGEAALRALGHRENSSLPPRDNAAQVAFSLTRDGDFWQISRGDRVFRLKDLRGVSMLARLVASPDREMHALVLAADADTDGQAPADLGDAGEVIDVAARDAYKARVAELREEISEAERIGDGDCVETLREELDALTRELAAAIGLFGKHRRAASSAERARVTVQRRVREAIRKIAEQDGELGRHLDWTIRTGLYSAYEPNGRKASR